jgi:hypothetical protein
MMRLDAAVLDTSALLALVGVLPVEAPDVGAMVAPDASLVEIITVLRSFHDGRGTDVLGDLTLIGAMVGEWIPTHRVAGSLADLVVSHPDELACDLAAMAAARSVGLPLVTGLPELARVDPAVAVVVLPRLSTN